MGVREPLTPRTLALEVKTLAHEAGFAPVGITSAKDFPEAEEAIIQRIREGLLDGLEWYKEARVRRGCHPREILPEARSIIAVGMNYYNAAPAKPTDGPLRGRVSRYAWGADYHKVFEGRMRRFVDALQELGSKKHVFYVDYGPLPDRAVAERAGIGWFGKNTNLLAPGIGSWLFLGEILTDLRLETDRPLKKHCGHCRACVPACPTNAIPSPYVIDNTRCISYHTIENRGPIPREIRPLMGDWVFGCDICQDACPVNERRATAGAAEFAPRSTEQAFPDLVALLRITAEEFERRYARSPIRRAKRVGLQRNACIALGNSKQVAAVPALCAALQNGEALVRGHAAWALGHIGGAEAQRALSGAEVAERDEWVREEIRLALRAATPAAPGQLRA